MQVKDFVIPYRRAEHDIRIYCLGDIHTGTIHCVEDDVKRKIQEIKRERAYWIGMGDYAEWITPSDKRYDPSQRAIAEWVEPDNIGECQIKFLVDLFSPIKDKCIGLLYGNHEESIRIFNHENVQKNLCDRLNVSNLGYSAMVRFYFNRQNSNEQHVLRGAFTHGAGAAITEGAKTNSLMRFMKAFNADFHAYGHLHDFIPKSLSKMSVDGDYGKGKIKQKVSMGAITGCWFRTYTQGVIASYGERKAYPPTEICCAYFSIDPTTGLVNVGKSI